MTLRFVERHRWLLDLQLAGDALIVSAFIYFTGGITSYFSSLYVLPIVAASTVQFRRGGLMVATLSAILYAGLVAGAVPRRRPASWRYPSLVDESIVLPPRSVAQYTVALNLFGFFAVGAPQRIAGQQPAVRRAHSSSRPRPRSPTCRR